MAMMAMTTSKFNQREASLQFFKLLPMFCPSRKNENQMSKQLCYQT